MALLGTVAVKRVSRPLIHMGAQPWLQLPYQELLLLWVLGLAWVLKVFLGLAQLTHLDPKCNA